MLSIIAAPALIKKAAIILLAPHPLGSTQ